MKVVSSTPIMQVGMLTVAILTCTLTLLSGCDSTDVSAGQAVVESDTIPIPAIPQRSANALTGTEFLEQTKGASYAERQIAAVCALTAGNVPENLRTLAPVRLGRSDGDSMTIFVMRDYLSIGPDEQDVRMPLSLPSARAVAEGFDMLLPTTRMVDAVYAQSDLKLIPQPMTPGPQMRSNDYYGRHHVMIEEQRAGRSPGGLVAGHKKDIVVSTRMYSQPDRVAIYGWHRSIGDPIQPLYLGHVDHYEDYSHGVRLVWPAAMLDGEMIPIVDLLDEPDWRSVLSDEPSLLIEPLSRLGMEPECE